jgi:hypothetical protein
MDFSSHSTKQQPCQAVSDLAPSYSKKPFFGGKLLFFKWIHGVISSASGSWYQRKLLLFLRSEP